MFRFMLYTVLFMLFAVPSFADDADSVSKDAQQGSKNAEQAKEQLKNTNAKTQPVVVSNARRPYGGSAANVPEEVEADDNSERLLMLLPGGPLVVRLEMTIDGESFRKPTENAVAKMLADADKDKDGTPKWDEADALFTGRLVYYGRNEKYRAQFVKQYDRDGDGIISPFEARMLAALQLGGPAFAMYNNSTAYATGANPDLFALFDTDTNEELSAEEIAKATERLKSRDADENDIVDAFELAGQRGAFRRAVGFAGRQVRQVQPLLGLIGRSMNVDEAWQALATRYGHEGKISAMKFTLLPSLSTQLDANENGLIEKEEVVRLNEIEPHLVLHINLGKTGELPEGLHIAKMTDELRERVKRNESGKGATLEMPGVNLDLSYTNNTVNRGNYAANAKYALTRFDADKNGYLEKKELADAQARYYAQNFDTWDADKDGKVFEEEIVKGFVGALEKQFQRVSVAAADMGGSMLEALDSSGDHRLGLREMRAADDRLKQFDKDGDGRITRAEVPSTIRFAAARGNNAYTVLRMGANAYYAQASGGGVAIRSGPTARKPAGPEWFTRMDRNGDGDVTLKEFLGDKEQFEKLDTNGDEFIELEEARAAE